MATWQDLRTLRQTGQRPTLPVIVSIGHYHMDKNMKAAGCMVIDHKAGQPFHGELLQGLRVLLFVGRCERAQLVAKSLLAKNVEPAELQVWCACMQGLTRSPASCELNEQWS
jgi:hypothetical protein